MIPSALRAVLVLACLLLFRGTALGEAGLWIPDLTVREGSPHESVFLHSSHDFPLSGFSFGIRYDPSILSIHEVTFEGTDLPETVDQSGFFSGAINSDKGEVVCGVVLDASPPLTDFLPPADDHTLARLDLEVKGKGGERTILVLADGLGDSFPVENELVDGQGISHLPALHSGTVLVHAPPIADAGGDLLAPEGELIQLDGSRSRSPLDLPLQYAWTQLTGDAAQALTGLETVRPLFSLPPLTEDQVLRFQLTVSDGHASSTDTVDVRGIDLDPRRATVAASTEVCARLEGAGRLVALFQGELRWGTDLEDARWTRVLFTASGDGDESRLLSSVSLHVDENGSGCLDEGDRRIGDVRVLESDNARVEFVFDEPVVATSPTRFFLRGEAAGPEASPARLLLPPWLLLLGGWAAFRKAGRRGGRKGGRRAPGVIALLLLPLLFHTSCGGGGGGQKGAASPVSREVRFSLHEASDVTLEGASTHVRGGVVGLPAHGRQISL